MTNDELKHKILTIISDALDNAGVEVDADLSDLKRIDDNTFQLKTILTLKEDEEDDDDNDGEGLQPEAEESDFED